jgi:membrane protein
MPMEEFWALIRRVVSFLKADIWRLRIEQLPLGKSLLIRPLRVLLLAIRGFDEDRCLLRASALTFYTLLSIVPVVAMAFGIAKGFGFEKLLEQQLLERFSAQQDIVTNVITFARSLLENTRGGMIAGIGLALLFWSVIKVLGHIENSFNEIWEVEEARSWGRKFSDYLSIMLISPVLVILSSSVTVFISTQVRSITEQIALLGVFSPLISIILKLLPYGLIWILFTMLYLLMPNTRVKLKPALVGGIAGGTIYQIVQWGYIYFQVGVARYNAIYGSFAALPLFLIWLQLSWLIVLFGAEIAFADQNADTYEFEPDSRRASPAFRKLIALHITRLLVKNFVRGEKPLPAEAISAQLDIPVRLVRSILHELVACGLLTEAETSHFKEVAYQPARDINQFTIQFVLERMEYRGFNDLPIGRSDELQRLDASLQTFRDTIAISPENRLLKEL